jgi:hypothetical protein
VDLYGQFYPYFDGALCPDAVKCTIGYESDQQEVVTLVKGFAGISPGPVKLVISYSGSVPTGDTFAAKVIKAFLNSAEIPIRVVAIGGQKIETTGFIRPGPKIDSGVGQTTTLDFEVVCSPAELA